MDDVRTRLQKALGDAFMLERELGGGGMSRTFLAHERALQRRVVVKVLAPELLAGISVERFKREVLLAAALQHPHVVPVLSTGDADGLPWFTMPYVDGDSLRVRLQRSPLSIAEVIGILRDVARALEFAHSRGIVHRDIKPDNVLLAGSSATVTDFGIAKAIAAARTMDPGSATLTAAGTALGTPAYMAPEQAAGDPSVDHRADLYAFGAMAFELLAGRPPFVADSQARLIGAHFSETPRDVRELRPDAPAGLALLIAQCLAKLPDDRPSSAAVLLDELDSLTTGSSPSATGIERGAAVPLGRALAWWGAASVAVVVTAWAATRSIGLPEWALPGAGGIALAGLPAVLGTWYVQRTSRRAGAWSPGQWSGARAPTGGSIATLALRASPHVSWRRTWIGGAAVVGAFALLVIGFTVLRALGMGPMGSLRGAGQFGDRETLVVADFVPPPTDSSLGVTVAEAVRTDLAQSASLSVLTRGVTGEVLQLMGREPGSALSFDVAREVAVREGAKAVLDGRIVQLGPSYVISARLVAAADGRELAVFRRTADSDADLVAALGKLSHDVRGKVGESLRDIREAQPLERVTTSSLVALRKYVEGDDALATRGDVERGRSLLREALTADSTFAMAWRRLAASYVGSGGRNTTAQYDAIQKAYRYRDRLSENERLLTEASYFSYGPSPDLDRSIASYEALLARDSLNSAALNNLATRYARKQEWARAVALLERATRLRRPFGGAFTNLIDGYLASGDLPGARRTLDRFVKELPSNPSHAPATISVLVAQGAYDSAQAVAQRTLRESTSPSLRDQVAFLGGAISFMRGQPTAGLRWYKSGTSSAQETGMDGRHLRLLDGMDSTFVAAFYQENQARARELLRRTLATVPMTSLPPTDREWSYLARLGQVQGDEATARAAYEGWLADTAAIGAARGEEAWYRGMVALAGGRGGEAIDALREADREYFAFARSRQADLAQAFDIARMDDSAIVYFERMVEHAPNDLEVDGDRLAGSYKRLGELLDARGDVERAEHYYQKFVELWKDAEPSLQPKVRQVRERLSTLRRRRG